MDILKFFGVVSCCFSFLYILTLFAARVFTYFNSFSCTFSTFYPLNLLIYRGFSFIQQALTSKWLRLWDEQGNLLLWSSELVEQKQQQIEQEKQRAERLAAQLKALGIEPES